MGLALTPENYPAIEKSLLEHGMFGYSYDWSFAESVDDVLIDGIPDQWLCTANSAIPLADTIRGHFAARKLPRPSIGYIRSDRTASHLHYTEAPRIQRIAGERHRLGQTITPDMKVVIVEEFYNTGRTTDLAREILTLLGIPPQNIKEASGAWYSDTNSEDMMLAETTSVHSDFMYSVGVRGALIHMPTNVQQ